MTLNESVTGDAENYSVASFQMTVTNRVNQIEFKNSPGGKLTEELQAAIRDLNPDDKVILSISG